MRNSPSDYSAMAIRRLARERGALERLRRKIRLGLILFAGIAAVMAAGVVWLLSHLVQR
jgi:hypothetical protein